MAADLGKQIFSQTGHNIVKNALIHQWVSLGFIEESNIFSTRQLSERYIKQLLGLSFLQLSKSPLTAGLSHEDVTLFTMHDLVHDIARLVMVDEILLDNKQDNSGGISYHYALLSNCFKPLESSTGYLAKIRALCFTNCREFRLSDGAFSSGKSLRVLDLSDCSIQKLPDYIGQLKQLRYLNAPGIQYQTIPNCISKLIKLMYLILRGSYEIVALPESNCSGIRELPESFGKLNKLNGEIHQDKLPLIGLPEVIGSLTNLKYLNLARCMDYVFGSPSTDQTDSFIGSISTFSNLEHLDLSKNKILCSIPESSSMLARLPECLTKKESLKVLNVMGCKLFEAKLPQSNFLFTLPHFVVHTGEGQSSSNLPLLEHAILDEFLELSRLENVKSTQEARSIKLIEKESINSLNLEWTGGADRFVEDMNVLGEMVPPNTLKKFVIEGYSSISFPSWVMNTGHHLPNLVSITLWDLPKCNSLPPFGQLPNLGEITLGRMHGIRRIDKGIYGGPGAFPRLIGFHLWAMHSLEELDFRDDLQTQVMFPMLQDMEISDCPKVRLKSSPPNAGNWTIILSDNVLSSRVERCHTSASSSSAVACLSDHLCKLVPMHQWVLLCHLPPLLHLHIDGCGDLSSASPEIIRALSSLKSLILEDNEKAEGLPRWLGELTCLQGLSLVGFQKLKDLEGNMRQLTSLQSLNLDGCSIME
uniref:NB-ARC domain-containing protein n=1 Tax=Oryza meridionalis TaxID=40149 RepID=A0A0E0F3J7_9ORYZ